MHPKSFHYKFVNLSTRDKERKLRFFEIPMGQYLYKN